MINWGKVFAAFTSGIALADKIGKGKTGKEKLQIALDSSDEFVDLIEAGTDKDVFNDPAVQALKVNAIEAMHALRRAVEAAKQAKGTGGPPQS